jgi:DNA-binding transcriptional regulator LsrR (DeoR family)
MSYDANIMIKVAKLYYKDNLKQESIARRLEISKYKVNRVLKEARKKGIVQITIIKP